MKFLENCIDFNSEKISLSKNLVHNYKIAQKNIRMQLGSLHDKLLLGQGLTEKSKKMLLTNDIGPPAVPGRVL